MSRLGEKLPALELEDPSGEPVELEDHYGRFLLVQCLRYYG
jgi:hypothetical protein